MKVTNNALITTLDAYSRGIYAASIGGGGGDGGSTSSASFSFNGICQMVSDNTGYECKPSQGSSENKTTKVSLSLTASVGGNGGAAGDGGDVSVEHDAVILTYGDLSHGIAARSIGGGGGDGGNGALGISAWTNNDAANTFAGLPGAFTFTPNFNNVTVNIGGSEGASGHGGSVSISGTGSIITVGKQAYGIHAQSIGGGGGTGGAGAGGVWAAVTVGGFGSGGGDGGDVTVDLSGGIETYGKGAVGVFAQSVGGGGGAAGDVETGWSQKWENLNIGAGLVVQNSAGDGGNGGKVTIQTGSITTTGQDAHGILAQSTGGSGGIVSVSGSIAHPGSMFVAGSAGDLGNGGDISITNNGAIKVSGSGAHGVIAQSTAGSTKIPTENSIAAQSAGDTTDQKNTAGNISINVNADIIASGENGRAILAQSQGATNGTISITVAEGATVSTSAAGAETVALFDGTNNTLNNNGTIRNEGTDPTDYVIRTNGSSLTVNNYGVIEGSVLSKANDQNGVSGPIEIINIESGTFGLGATMNLGERGSLTNLGTMSAGTVGTIGSTGFTGLLAQTNLGTLVVDYVPGGANDLITVTSGSNNPGLGGTVLPASQGTVSSKSGTITILNSEVPFNFNQLSVSSTATVAYSLSQVSQSGGGEAITLSYSIDYAPWANDPDRVPGTVAANITQNHTNFGAHLDDLLRFRQNNAGDEYSFIDNLLHTIHGIEDFDELLEFYAGFAPAELFAPAEATVQAALRFSGGLQDCPGFELGGLRVSSPDYCGWFQINGAHNKRDSGRYNLGYTANDVGMFGGVKVEVAQDWFASVALGLEASDVDARKFSANGPRFHAGLGLKREIGATSVGATVSAGFGSFDIERLVTTPEGEVVHTGDPNLSWFSAMAHLSHTFALGERAYVRPQLDAGILYLHQSGYREQQGDLYGLTVGPINHTVGVINPSIEFGSSFTTGGMPVEGSIKAGLLAFVGEKDWSSTLRLNGLPEDGPSYTITDKRQRVFGTLGASLKVGLTENASFELGGSALFNGDQQQFSGGARLSVRF